MKYIIMCGGNYQIWKEPRQLTKINNEPIVVRTIRLLREAGVEDIAISSNDSRFEGLGVPVLKHDNPWTVARPGVSTAGSWLDAFYMKVKSACYIFGDVVFSEEAIQKIVETETDDIEFFASAPPFAKNYSKPYAEPFAFKVANMERFKGCLAKAKELDKQKQFRRDPIAWELWQVIKDTEINKIDYTNYTAINDYTCDIDEPKDVEKIEPFVKTIKPLYMIHTCLQREWYVNDYLIPSMLEQGIKNENIIVYVDRQKRGCLKSSIDSFTQASKMSVDGIWHLQDDVIICKDFAKRTKELSSDYTVCGFASYYDREKKWEPGDSNGLKMWYSFPCIYIPTKIIKSYVEWFNQWVWHDPQYRMWVNKNKYDDTIFRIYMENYYPNEYVLNLKPNLVDHIDYLLGGSTINERKEDKKQVRALWFDDLDLVEELEKRIKNL